MPLLGCIVWLEKPRAKLQQDSVADDICVELEHDAFLGKSWRDCHDACVDDEAVEAVAVSLLDH